MGGKSSTLRSTAPGTPSMAFGRLRIDSPHTVRSPHHHRTQRAAEGNDEVGFSSSKPYHASWVDLRSLETKPLLAKTVAGPGAGAMPTERLLLTHVSTASMESIVPPMVVWIGPALLCALAYALYNIFIKKGSASIHPVLGGVILQLVAAILGSLLLGFIIVQQHQMEADNDNVGLYYDSEGVKYAVYAGIAVGTAEMLSFFVSSLGVQAMQSIPIIIGGSVMFGCVLGFVLLKEALSFRGWLGVLMISGGISLVGLDPGASGLH